MSLPARWPAFMGVVAEARDAGAIFRALGEIAHAHVGTGLFTASVFDRAAGQARRIYSENETAYPVGGLKPITPNRWTAIVLDRHETFATLRIEEIATVFPDWELIRSLGFESNLNLPAVVGGSVIGTVNLLDRAGFYTADKVAAAADLTPFATLAFLAARHLPSGRDER